MSLQKIVNNYYNDPKTGLNTSKIIQKIRDEYPEYTPTQIRNELNKIENVQQFKRITGRERKKQFSKTFAVNSFDNMHIDIADLPNYKTPQNRHTRYVFVCVDVMSRFAWARPQTSKVNSVNVASFRSILEAMKKKFGKTPKSILSDLEFDTKEFRALCKEYGIKQYFSDRINKGYAVQIAERFIGTLKLMISKFVKLKNTTNYTDSLQDILHNYNTSIHSGINTDPLYAIEHNMTYKKPEQNAPDNFLETGVRVRTRLKRTITSKGDIVRFSKATYKIVKREGKKYQLQNENTGEILEHFYPRHLLQVVEEVIEKKPSGLDDIIRKRAQKRVSEKKIEKSKSNSPQPKDLNEVIEKRKSPSGSPEPKNVDDVIKKVQNRNKFKRKIKKGGLDDRAHKIIPEGKKTIFNENLEKIKSKREATCDVCEKTIYRGQPTYHNKTKDIDICEDCMANYLIKEAKKPKNLDEVVLRRSKRVRRKPERYRK